MKCETDKQLHDALTALIDGTIGPVHDGLMAIRDYLNKRPTVTADTLAGPPRNIARKSLDKQYKKYYTLAMPIDGIEWDSEKALSNLQKHHVSFEDAQYIFSDPERLERYDRSGSNASGEDRWQALGMVGKTLFAVYTERGKTRQLITARVATKKERRSYNGYYQIDDEGWGKAARGSIAEDTESGKIPDKP